MITRLEIQHFRSIEHLDLELDKVSVLVGVNGAGKSNILDAIAFIRDAVRDGLDQAVTDRQAIQTIRQWSPTRPYNITLSIDVRRSENAYGSFSFTLAARGSDYVIRSEEGKWYERAAYRVSDRRSKTGYRTQTHKAEHSFVREENGKVKLNDHIRDKSQTFKVDDSDELFINSRYAYDFAGLSMLISNFETYSIFPITLRQPEKQSGEIYLKSHGENLASLLRRMRRKRRVEAINEIVDSLKYVLPGLKNVTVQSVAGLLTPQFLVGDVADTKPHYFHVNQMSDGTLRILGLLVALYQDPRPATIALEEPELTVHPGVLKMIAESIHEVSENTQIIVTTHSPELVENFAPNEMIAVELEGGNTVAKPLDSSQVDAVKQKLLSLGELMSVEGLHG